VTDRRLHTSRGWQAEHAAELVVRTRGLDVTVVVEAGEPEAGPTGWPRLVQGGELVAAGAEVARVLWADGGGDAPSASRSALDDARDLQRLARAAGFAASQAEYEPAYHAFFAALDHFEAALAESRFLGGAEPSLADLWLFAALVRFEGAWYSLYKVNRGLAREMAQLGGYLRDLHQRPGFADTVDWDAIKRMHYLEDARIAPKQRVARGVPDLWGPHDRAERFARAEVRAVGTEEQRGARGRGEWVRGTSAHRRWITADGSSGLPAEAGRYHLYIANNCPWCHRVALTRAVKGLQDVVSMDVLWYRRDPERGWQFRPDEPGCTEDTVFGFDYARQVYEREGSTERSVPILFDTVEQRVVNNESSEIMRMLDRAFGALAARDIELAPDALVDAIDRVNAWTYTDVNNGAYKAGFTSDQRAHDLAYARYFSALERLDRRLRTRRFLCGEQLTEADLRLFPTLFRHDHVYYTRFRLDHRRIRDYPDLYRWLRDVLAVPGVAEASNLDHCRKGYFGRNANQVVPLGPEWEFE